ncbi:DEAD/DEAH box helicase [Geomonas paludis]|uniref:DEAD/DEAH box helicase n=1 Tax=Geomonas paludis TaxID=2740185 RepID=A0A6V8N049_9BACT|nr:protein DpdJ [Geomonas paludis]UPU36623.1 DEAD/DEAH box helicase [Geomonas paludis]GFO65886.1 hypothetical protein GMPD_38050 [Geomonas paludis]
MEEFLRQCLDAIEERETRFLVWGVVDIALSENELLDLIAELLENASDEVQGQYFEHSRVITDLLERAFVVQFFKEEAPHYRSRMAETVRLASRLRQLFPKHEGATGWQQAPTLVADYRFLRRKRKFPVRNLLADQVLEECRATDSTLTQIDLLRKLLERPSAHLSLAGFQGRATSRILQGLNKRESRGTIVCAGTGSGKTLSFYLPALTHIAGVLVQQTGAKQWVKVLAIYPRNELLKDQFSEIYGEARRLDQVLAAGSRRKIRIGAFFGPTPYWPADVKDSAGWKRVATGYACEYFRCPTEGCRGRLIWTQAHIDSKTEQLTCDLCGHVISEDEIVLTRSRLLQTPPDILFTTTEMLNQRMSDNRYHHLFGLGRAVKGPDLVLLDEVHTYTGTHGAQVAYLFRRWRALVRQNVSFVGLSATLREAPAFFASLTGLKEWAVAEVSPRFDEIAASGAEYLLALRGDPVSRRSLLSTTIQTAMLMNRCIDMRGGRPGGGAYGSKTFVFTDDVDVTNRLFFNLLDAEGKDSWGRPDLRRHPNGGLAYLRTSGTNASRYLHGQDWSLCEQIGRILSDGLIVGRTCAQDAGVDLAADIIVATASLEVGFNDPEVGAVIQHKAPRDMAQFLQRKGRAGRSRVMRPWTVVSLSDYGRDRLAYQGYDLLFDPELPPRQLPLRNRYVQRMQGVYALIDYLSTRLQGSGRGSVWQDLSAPVKGGERKRALEKELSAILESSDTLAEFTQALGRLLQVENDVLLSLLWEYPRPLLTTVIPTALRRIATDWGGGESSACNAPLPEFTAANLFSDLNLPEVVLDIPPQQGFEDGRPPIMPVLQAMRAFAPGRVSRRYGFAHQYVRHWIAPGFVRGEVSQTVDISLVGQCRRLGEYRYNDAEGQHSIAVYRPTVLKPELPPAEVLDTSNAWNLWRTEIVPQAMTTLEVPRNSGWESVVSGIGFSLHNHQSPLDMRRFSLGTEASIAFKRGGTEEVSFSFRLNGEPVALGFALAVDAVSFRVVVPPRLWQDGEGHRSEKWRALRTTRYYDMAWRGERLVTVSNPFARDWVARVYLSALALEALEKEISLEEAAVGLQRQEAVVQLGEVLDTIFQSTASEDEGGGGEEDRLRQDILDFLRLPVVRAELRTLAETLWEPIDDSWQPWLKGVFCSTLAGALFQGVQNLCPDLNTEDLIVDIEADVTWEGCVCDRIWISESSTGGSGLIEEVIERFGEDPRQFFNLVEAALDLSEYELIDGQLNRFLDLLADGEEKLYDAVRSFRNAATMGETEEHFHRVRTELQAQGFLLFHSFMVALNNRLLRSGSNEQVDHLIHEVITTWKGEEARLGIEIDARVVAYLMSHRLPVENYLDMEVGTHLSLWRFNALYGVLWPRGATVRQVQLTLYNPYCSFPPVERLLLRDLLQKNIPVLWIPSEKWQEKCLHELQRGGALRICCANREKEALKDIFNFLMTNPVEDDYLLLFPRLRSVRQLAGHIEVEVELAEAVQ